MIRHLGQVLALCAAMALVHAPGGGRAAAAGPMGFNRDIQPILAENCLRCHGPDHNARKADLRLDLPESALSVLQPSQSGQSEVARRITAADPEERMPPPESGKRLDATQIDMIMQWLQEGAEYETHWAFIPPERPALPAIAQQDWPGNGLDYFILARLEAEGLRPAPQAGSSALLRRASLDLCGLPPTLEELEALESDASANAFEKAVDRLLASERYGEHMALSWLEAARYADTDGYQNDRFRYMHVWRDWVIMALNDNMPFDQFVIEQLAGDMLPGATLRQQIASGFNRNHRINSESGSHPEEWLVENVVDRVDTLGTVFLGLTFGCARCHEHKYDPMSQKEYYQLFAQFNSITEWGLGPNNGNTPPFITVPDSWPELSPEEDRFIVPAPVKIREVKNADQRPMPGAPDTVMVMHEMPEPRPAYLLKRGLYSDPDKSEVVQPGVPRVLLQEGEDAPADRLELARWLVGPANPLTARVAVNRYWQHFFGTGLVKTSENFGLQGDFPSHPELLDWLATEFIRLDWDVKAFQKMIVLSATYRQAPAVSKDLLERDPKNRLLARGPRLRLTGHQLRDQALFVSGLLVEKLGGPPVKPYMPPKLWESISNAKYEQGAGDELYRRSLYTYWRRTTPPPTMTNFNEPDRDLCAVRKESTNTPLHALTLMNNVTFVEAARFLAERMLCADANLEKQLLSGFRRVTARKPASVEMEDLREAFHQFRAQFAGDPGRADALLRMGEKPRDAELDQIDLAAMTMVASALLNLDEAIVKN